MVGRLVLLASMTDMFSMLFSLNLNCCSPQGPVCNSAASRPVSRFCQDACLQLNFGHPGFLYPWCPVDKRFDVLSCTVVHNSPAFRPIFWHPVFLYPCFSVQWTSRGLMSCLNPLLSTTLLLPVLVLALARYYQCSAIWGIRVSCIHALMSRGQALWCPILHCCLQLSCLQTYVQALARYSPSKWLRNSLVTGSLTFHNDDEGYIEFAW